MHSGHCNNTAVLLDEVLERVDSKKPMSGQDRRSIVNALQLAKKVLNVAHAGTKVEAAGIGGGEASYAQQRWETDKKRTHPTVDAKATLEQYVKDYTKADSTQQQPQQQQKRAKKGKVQQKEEQFDHLPPVHTGSLYYTPLQAMELLAAEKKSTRSFFIL